MTINRFLTAAMVLLPLTGLAQVTPKGDGYSFRLKLVSGKTYRFLIESTRAGTQGFNVTMPLVLQVTSVKGGIATVKVTQGPMMAGGKNQGRSAQRVTKIAADGSPVGTGGGLFPTPAFPNRSLKIGEVWKANAPLGQVAGQITARYKFRGIRTQKGKRLAEIGIAVDSVVDTLSFVGNGSMFVSMSDGLLQSMGMTMLAKPKGQGAGSGVHLVTMITRK